MANSNNENRTPVRATTHYFFRKIWQVRPSIYFYYIANIVVNLCRPLIMIILPKFIIDELMGERNITQLITYILIIVLGNEAVGLLSNYINCRISNIKDDLSRHFELLLSEKSMQMDFVNTENTQVLDFLEKAKNGMRYAGGPTALIECICYMATGVLLAVQSVIILLTGSAWIILIVLVAVLLHTYLTMKENQIQMFYFQKRANFDRSFAYILWQLSNYRFGKDIRLFNAQDMMLEKAEYYNGNLAMQTKEQFNSTLKFTASDMLVSTLQSAIIYFYLGIQVIHKTITFGDFTMYINAGNNFMSGIQSAVGEFQQIFNKCFYLNEFVAFINYPDKVITGMECVKEKEDHTLEFKNVSFKYPCTDVYALKDVSLTIHSGEHISIVGMNGAGKTTFIKLLCRLYDVEQGEILLDGVNIADYDYEQYTKLFSVIFQDFKLFSFSVAENIACSEQNINYGKIEEELKKVGLLEKFNGLEHQLDTNLFKDFDESGIEPSGGEQQKLAIARAIHRDAPIIILDEPTAALDPIAEMEVYTHFNDLIGKKTALYISHRLSSCKFCDRIVVFKEGHLIENGTHDELIQIEDGEYAKMFETQAAYYQ